MDADYLHAKQKLGSAKRKLKRMKYKIKRQQNLVWSLEDELNWMRHCRPDSGVGSAAHQAVERPEVEAGSSEVGRGDFGDEGVATSSTLQTS